MTSPTKTNAQTTDVVAAWAANVAGLTSTPLGDSQTAVSLTTTVHAMLLRFTELDALMLRAQESAAAAQALMPQLEAKETEIRALYARIDALQAYMDAVDRAVVDMEQRVDALDGGTGLASVKNMLSSWWGKVAKREGEQVSEGRRVEMPRADAYFAAP